MEPYQQLERDFAAWNDLDPAGIVACSSGTAALHLALEALQLPRGSKVVVPDFTMIACPRAVTLAGLEPVFVDCDNNLLMNHFLITKAAAANYTLAVMAVHIYGRTFDFGDDWDAPSCYVIEDLAEAHGVRPHSKTDAACWSFYRNKIIAGEEGGAVWFRNPAHATLARQLRSLGFTAEHDFNHVPRGHNYRLSNAHARLILDSLARVDDNLRQRRTIEGWYDECCQPAWRMPPRQVVWVYDLRIPGLTTEQQTQLVKALQANGVAARHAFKPCSTQEEYRGSPVGENALRLSREVIYLPVQPGITTQESVKKAFGILKDAYGLLRSSVQ